MTTIAQSGGKEQSKQAFTEFYGRNLRMAELIEKLRNSVLQFERHYDKITYVVIKERWSAAAADAEGASGRKKEKQIRAGLRCGFEPFILAV